MTFFLLLTSLFFSNNVSLARTALLSEPGWSIVIKRWLTIFTQKFANPVWIMSGGSIKASYVFTVKVCGWSKAKKLNNSKITFSTFTYCTLLEWIFSVVILDFNNSGFRFGFRFPCFTVPQRGSDFEGGKKKLSVQLSCCCRHNLSVSSETRCFQKASLRLHCPLSWTGLDEYNNNNSLHRGKGPQRRVI